MVNRDKEYLRQHENMHSTQPPKSEKSDIEKGTFENSPAKASRTETRTCVRTVRTASGGMIRGVESAGGTVVFIARDALLTARGLSGTHLG